MKKEVSLKSGQVITIKDLEIGNLPEIIELQQKVCDSLTDKSFLQPLTEEEFNFIFGGRGMMIGAFHDNRLIAFRAMLDPEIDNEHLGIDAGLNETELPTVLYSEISNVSPEYRGNGLQRILGELLMDQVDTNRYRYICTTVAPFNIASLKDKFSLGMHIVSLKVKYGDLLRYTMLKILNNNVEFQSDTIKVNMSDITKQQSLIDEGWVGVSMEDISGEWEITFKRK